MTITFDQVRREWHRHPLRIAEVPTEHFVGLPLPTTRFGVPSWASFAAPASRSPDGPTRVGTPDRWWALDDRAKHIVVFAHRAAVAFGDIAEGPVTLTPPVRDVDQRREDTRMLGELMTQAAPAFFAGQAADADLRRDLAVVLAAILPAETMGWYRALVPDFFAWLEG